MKLTGLNIISKTIPYFCPIATTYSSSTRMDVETTTIINKITSTTTTFPFTSILDCYDKKKGCNLADCSQNISKVLCLKTCNSCHIGYFSKLL